MDFQQAIDAHVAWKSKLSIYLRTPDGSLKSADICVDNKCALGQWIYGEGSKHNANPLFQTLKNNHAQFHKAASEIVSRADRGEKVTEDIALGAKSEFAMISSQVVNNLRVLRDTVK